MGGKMFKSSEMLTPLDGEFFSDTRELADIFSEKGLIKKRVTVEGEYLIFLSEHPQIDARSFNADEKNLVRGLYDISTEDAQIVKDIETKGYKNIKATNHDVKAVEYYIKDKLSGTSIQDSLEWTHWALTSEDTNNLAYGLMLSRGIGDVIIPAAEEICKALDKAVKNCSDNESYLLENVSYRLEAQLDKLKDYKISVKLNGATGNYNAQYAAYPDVDWLKFTGDFIERLNSQQETKIKLVPNFVTTQIEPHDTYAELFDIIKGFNTILFGNYKENYAGIANALLTHFSSKLPISRLQRDLSDSTVERNFGVALGYSLVAYRSALKGINEAYLNIKESDTSSEIIEGEISPIEALSPLDGRYSRHTRELAEIFSDKSFDIKAQAFKDGALPRQINALVPGLMLSDGLTKVIIPAAEEICKNIDDSALKYKSMPMLARTHGQPASPTTVGKEMKVFSSRLKKGPEKLNGKEHVKTYSGDKYADVFDIVKRFNAVLLDFNQDMWRYISDDWFVQKTVEGEVGSSTMPHKVNPIDFENSEGNLGIANAMLNYLEEAMQSRDEEYVDIHLGTARSYLKSMQLKDKVDHEFISEKNIGAALGYCIVAYKSALKGLGKISVNEPKVIEALENHPEIVSEAIQIVLRREGVRMPYEQLKELTRGKKITMEDIARFINGLDVSDELKDELMKITPRNYTGIAEKIVGMQ